MRLPLPKARALQPHISYPAKHEVLSMRHIPPAHLQIAKTKISQPSSNPSADQGSLGEQLRFSANQQHPAKRQKLQEHANSLHARVGVPSGIHSPSLAPNQEGRLQTSTSEQQSDGRDDACFGITIPSLAFHQQGVLRAHTSQRPPGADMGAEPRGNACSLDSSAPAMHQDAMDDALHPPLTGQIGSASNERLLGHAAGPHYPHWHHPDATRRPQPSQHSCHILDDHGPQADARGHGPHQDSLQVNQGLGAFSSNMEVIWRVPMRECVDAAPLVLVQPEDRPFTCSHGRSVSPADVSSMPPAPTPDGTSLPPITATSLPQPLHDRGAVEPDQTSSEMHTLDPRTPPLLVSNQAVSIDRHARHWASKQSCQQPDADCPLPASANQHMVHQASRQESRSERWWVYACSHGGDVVAVEGVSGEPVWETRLPARLNAGMALSQDCLVGSAHLRIAVHLSVSQ